MFCMIKKKNYILPMFQNIVEIVKTVLLIALNREGWYYLAIKKLSAFQRGIMKKHYGDFFCLNCLHSFATEKKTWISKKLCENKSFCIVVMPFNFFLSFILYSDLECLIEKFDECKNNFGNTSITKVGEHIPSVFLIL